MSFEKANDSMNLLQMFGFSFPVHVVCVEEEMDLLRLVEEELVEEGREEVHVRIWGDEKEEGEGEGEGEGEREREAQTRLHFLPPLHHSVPVVSQVDPFHQPARISS